MGRRRAAPAAVGGLENVKGTRRSGPGMHEPPYTQASTKD